MQYRLSSGKLVFFYWWWGQCWRFIVHCGRSWRRRTVRMDHLADRRHLLLLTINRHRTVLSLPVIGLWWLPTACHDVCVAVVNWLFICCRRMHLFWRGVITLRWSLRTCSVLLISLLRYRRLWTVRILQLNACTSWGRCPAFNLPIACSHCWRLSRGIRLAFNGMSDNMCIFCILNKKSSVGFARTIHVFHFVLLNRVSRPSRDLLSSPKLKYAVNQTTIYAIRVHYRDDVQVEYRKSGNFGHGFILAPKYEVPKLNTPKYVTLQKLTAKIEHCLNIFLYLYSLVGIFLSYFFPK
jgi:hypothetical protein